MIKNGIFKNAIFLIENEKRNHEMEALITRLIDPFHTGYSLWLSPTLAM